MAKSNLSQHEQLLKTLEKSIREISEKQNEVDDTIHQAWALSNTVRNMTMQLFVMADDLRSTRLDFEKETSVKDSTS
jgi:ABC-type transporter Mla subunit MlaD